MRFNQKLFSVLLVPFAIVCFAFQVRADNDDPPTRVARLAYTQGSVSFQPAGTDDWVAAGVNRPMTTGDKIWSDNDGRVELQLDGSLIRLSQNTGCSSQLERQRHASPANCGKRAGARAAAG
jgi:hypothetical protein